MKLDDWISPGRGVTLLAEEVRAIHEAYRLAGQSAELASVVAGLDDKRFVTVASQVGWFHAPVDRLVAAHSGRWSDRPQFDLVVRVDGWEHLSIRAKIEDDVIVDQARGDAIAAVVDFTRVIEGVWPDERINTWTAPHRIRVFRSGPLDGLRLTPEIPFDQRPLAWPQVIEGSALGFRAGRYVEGEAIAPGGTKAMNWEGED